MTDTTTPLPPVVDRDIWTAQVNQLRVRETAHTRDGDAIAATRLDAAERPGPVSADRHFGFLVCYLRDGDKVYETYRTAARGNEPMGSSYLLMDLTVYGRQESWEDSPECWPQHWSNSGGQMALDGRPIARWSRIEAGRNDELDG